MSDFANMNAKQIAKEVIKRIAPSTPEVRILATADSTLQDTMNWIEALVEPQFKPKVREVLELSFVRAYGMGAVKGIELYTSSVEEIRIRVKEQQQGEDPNGQTP